jgi:hypothetical protein
MRTALDKAITKIDCALSTMYSDPETTRVFLEAAKKYIEQSRKEREEE